MQLVLTCIERFKLIDKGNNHAVCPTCDELETWEHVMLWDKQQDKRDACVKNLEKSFNNFAKKGKATKHEVNTVKEMTNGLVKYFNK